jgi:hypothetical protein
MILGQDPHGSKLLARAASAPVTGGAVLGHSRQDYDAAGAGQMLCFQTTSSRSLRLRQPSAVRVIVWW